VAAAFGKTVQVFLSNPSGFHKMGEVEVGLQEANKQERAMLRVQSFSWILTVMTQESLDKTDCRLLWASGVVRGNTSL